jgi:hypothetical protein
LRREEEREREREREREIEDFSKRGSEIGEQKRKRKRDI